MSINRELNLRLFEQMEEQSVHVEYSHEFSYYGNIANGNVDEVKKILADPDNVNLYDSREYGKLSNNSLQNIRYHFVVSVALITRLCVEKGLERELAYTLSDLYIGKMDLLQDARQIISLHNDMLLDFTHKMSDLPKNRIYSIQVIKAIEYINNHLSESISVQTVANELKVNRSYLSSLFKKETGKNISGFIRSKKIKAAISMLLFSDNSYSDIAEYYGFSSQSHFIQCFRKETGYTPMEYRRKFFRNVPFN